MQSRIPQRDPYHDHAPDVIRSRPRPAAAFRTAPYYAALIVLRQIDFASIYASRLSANFAGLTMVGRRVERQIDVKSRLRLDFAQAFLVARHASVISPAQWGILPGSKVSLLAAPGDRKSTR